jgi:hypothetical protein
MAKQPNDTVEKTIYTARFPSYLYKWMREETTGTDLSLNDFIVRAVEDIESWFGLPRLMVVSLEADRTALGLSRRDYVMHLLTRRYEQLLTHKPGFDGQALGSPKKSGK